MMPGTSRGAQVLTAAVAAAVSLLFGTAAAAGDELATRILVVPLAGDVPAEAEAATAAVARGAEATGARVTLATASLEESAMLVGCEPGQAACLSRVATALNVDRILYGELTGAPAARSLKLTLVSRDASPLVAEIAGVEPATDGDRIAEETARLVVEAETAPAAAPVAVKAPPDRVEAAREPGPDVSPLTWGLLGGGLVAIAAGGGLWKLAADKQTEIDRAPVETVADFEMLETLEGAARRRAWAGNLLVGVGIVAVAGGTTLLVLQLGDRERADGVALAPVFGADIAGVRVSGAW